MDGKCVMDHANLILRGSSFSTPIIVENVVYKTGTLGTVARVEIGTHSEEDFVFDGGVYGTDEMEWDDLYDFETPSFMSEGYIPYLSEETIDAIAEILVSDAEGMMGRKPNGENIDCSRPQSYGIMSSATEFWGALGYVARLYVTLPLVGTQNVRENSSG